MEKTSNGKNNDKNRSHQHCVHLLTTNFNLAVCAIDSVNSTSHGVSDSFALKLQFRGFVKFKAFTDQINVTVLHSSRWGRETEQNKTAILSRFFISLLRDFSYILILSH